jgi:hypothetical protein
VSRAFVVAALAVAAAAALIALPSYAFVRSTGDNGRCLWWRNPVGIPVLANLEGGPSGLGCSGQAEASSLLEASLAAWGGATRPTEGQSCTSARFDYRGLTTVKAAGFDPTAGAANENLIVFRHGACSANPACGSDLELCADETGCWPHDSGTATIAITTTSYRPSTGEIVDADMELHDNSGSGVGYFFTCLNQANSYCGRNQPGRADCVSTDVGSIVTHEAGHMLGLDHPPDKPSATMFATYTPGSVSLRVLDLDDVNGVCAVYPAGGSPAQTCTTGGTVDQAPPPNGGGSGGCSTAMGGVLSMMGVALALARRRALTTR